MDAIFSEGRASEKKKNYFEGCSLSWQTFQLLALPLLLKSFHLLLCFLPQSILCLHTHSMKMIHLKCADIWRISSPNITSIFVFAIYTVNIILVLQPHICFCISTCWKCHFLKFFKFKCCSPLLKIIFVYLNLIL